MRRPLDVFNELADLVVIQPRPGAEGSSLHLEGFRRQMFPARVKAETEKVVDDFLEGAPRPPGLRLESGRHIIVQR